jgi:sec-independent protein translocase protein TatC
MSIMRRMSQHNPDEVRMSFGDHLEELRKRVIWALVGLVITSVLCCKYGDHIIAFLTTPYMAAMNDLGQEARLVQLNPIESFMEYFKVCLEFGLVLAAPWVLYQLWLFVAAGLYPAERRIVRYFAPASIGLFITGATFMIVVVLSGLMKFLISIAGWFPLPDPDSAFYRFLQTGDRGAVVATQPFHPIAVPVMTDPGQPQEGDVWLNPRNHRLNVYHEGETYYAPMQKASNKQIVQPFFSVAEYLGFVTDLALAFGLGFQIPIVVIFLIAMGIVQSAQMSAARRYVLLVVVIAAAVITPTPDVGTMMLLAVPMYILFESGLLIGRIIEKRDAQEPSGTVP